MVVPNESGDRVSFPQYCLDQKRKIDECLRLKTIRKAEPFVGNVFASGCHAAIPATSSKIPVDTQNALYVHQQIRHWRLSNEQASAEHLQSLSDTGTCAVDVRQRKCSNLQSFGKPWKRNGSRLKRVNLTNAVMKPSKLQAIPN